MSTCRAANHSLLDLFLHHGHALCLWVLEAVGGAAKVTQDVVAPVVEQDVLHLHTHTHTGRAGEKTRMLDLPLHKLQS